MSDKNKIDFGVKALILKDNKFLAMHKSGVKEDLWELPGGRMEFGERAEDTLKREINEETGLEPRIVKLLDTWNLMLRENYQITGIIYICKIENRQIKLSEEHDRFRWIDIGKEYIDLMYPAFRDRMVHWDWNEIKKI